MSNDDYFKSAEISESLSSLAKISKVQLIEKLTEAPTFSREVVTCLPQYSNGT